MELKPCPFCGWKARIYEYGALDYSAECENKECIASSFGTSYENEALAAEAWNRRAE